MLHSEVAAVQQIQNGYFNHFFLYGEKQSDFTAQTVQHFSVRGWLQHPKRRRAHCRQI